MERWTIDLSTEAWRSDPAAKRAVDMLRSGDLVAIPTETVYGLAADATNALACARIFEAKGRPQFNPLICHVESVEAARLHGRFDNTANKLAAAFWPGPLTLVLPKRAESPICDLAIAGLPSVALRVPSGPVMRLMAQRIGRPLAAPSANISGRISPTQAEDVIADLASDLGLVIDAGACAVGLESTIVAVSGGRARLLRPGGIEREELETVLGYRLDPVTSEASDTVPEAPGMLSSHYAPRAGVRLNATSVNPGEALLAFGPIGPDHADRATKTISLSATGDLREAAARLFTALRELDQTGCASICVQPIPATGLGEAINDRLRRAAAPRA